MYESYSKQSLPSRKYRELLGTALCVFNSNNSFVIENILKNDKSSKYNWYGLIDKTSGALSEPIKQTITENSNTDIAKCFNNLVEHRNRIMHSFQVTTEEKMSILDNDRQVLATKYKNGKQEIITEDFLMKFIELNDTLSSKLHKFRGY